MIQKIRIFITGANGYIGGSVLSRLIDHPKRASFAITALVRHQEKAQKLKGLGLDIKVVVGTTEDLELITNLAADADVVISVTDDENIIVVENILKGLKRRHHETRTVPILIQFSSTDVIADLAVGMYASKEIYSDLDTDRIWSKTPASGAQFQDVNKPIARADAEGYIRSYIICLSLIVGSPSNSKLYDAGIQNHHYLATMLLGIARKCGGPRVIGQGKNMIGMATNVNVADLFIRLFDSITQNKPGLGHGREGIYFASEMELSWNEFATVIGKVLVAHGEARSSIPQPYSKEELTRFGNQNVPEFLDAVALGANTRARPDRGRQLGWKPASKEQVFQTFRTTLEAGYSKVSRKSAI
ncbi:NAD(P)-binding protein [Phlegmacium glaucopus]|nr:NAD(P)-binding protein [Phlegmacium glaucopus]